jgi:hypothetical protein
VYDTTPSNQLLPPAITLGLRRLPLGIMVFVLVRDVLASIRPTNMIFRVIYRGFRLFIRPFRDYMQLEDMKEYDPSHPVMLESPQWKKWFLISAGAVAGIGWAIVSTLIVIVLAADTSGNSHDRRYLIYASSSSFCWVLHWYRGDYKTS